MFAQQRHSFLTTNGPKYAGVRAICGGPVLILHAKPITNNAKRAIPKIIVNFSLIFILIFNHALILLVNQLAFLNNLSSSYKDETS